MSDIEVRLSGSDPRYDAVVARLAVLEGDATLTDHLADTTAVHGIADTSALETTAGAQAKADVVDAALTDHLDDAAAAHAASAVSYDNGSSGLAATDVNAAIDEVAASASGTSAMTKSTSLFGHDPSRFDAFDRPNENLGVSPSSSGHSWIANSGTIPLVSGRLLPGAGTVIATQAMPSALSNGRVHTVRAVLHGNNTDWSTGLIVGWTDVNNYAYARYLGTTGTIEWHTVVAGVDTVVATKTGDGASRPGRFPLVAQVGREGSALRLRAWTPFLSSAVSIGTLPAAGTHVGLRPEGATHSIIVVAAWQGDS